MAWKNRRDLPANWDELRRQAAKRAGGQCERIKPPHGLRCPRPGTELNHAGDPADHRLSELEWLCSDCHREVTQRQAAEGIRRRWSRLKHPAAR